MKEPIPEWIRALEVEDGQFLKRFLLASGSLKQLAEDYGISYPTVRTRLDRLILKVQAVEKNDAQDDFHRELRIQVASGQLSADLAKRLLKAHQVSLEQKEDPLSGGGQA